MPINAWLTDIGNDLAYEVPVDQVIGWVEGCLDRLLSLGAQVMLTDLPVNVLRTVSASRYRVFRAIFFPACGLGWDEMLRRAEQLSGRLHALARSRKTPVFSADCTWYGWDPIHPRRRHYVDLWQALLEQVVDDPIDWSKVDDSWLMRWYLHLLHPAQWSHFSIPRSAQQPNGRFQDGTTISLY
ncbi:MAG: hypothetical protein MK171_13165 [Pirellulales bacterium]|nr:hypothetical protein [Pirellulales bacterium]